MTTTTNGYMLGTGSTTGTFKLLSTWLLPDPESQHKDYAMRVKLGDGTTRGVGYPIASWHYGFLTAAQWTVLKSFCSAESANVYIATMKNDGTYVEYSATMVLPETYTVRATRYVDVTVEFNNLVTI